MWYLVVFYFVALVIAQTDPAPCEATQYRNPNGVCVDCTLDGLDFNCASSSCTWDVTSSQVADLVCTACKGGYELNPNKGCDALQTCPLCPTPGTAPCPDSAPFCCGCGTGTGYCRTSACMEDCAVGPCDNPTPDCQTFEYVDPTTNMCTECPTLTGCSGSRHCTSKDAVYCTECDVGYVLHDDGQCVVDCGSMQYYNADKAACEDCLLPDNCAIAFCSAVDNSACTECADGFLKGVDGLCTEPCPEIEACAKVRCTVSSQACVTCNDGYQINDNFGCTLSECRSIEYRDPTTNLCKECPSTIANCVERTCSIATGAAAPTLVCHTCADGFVPAPAGVLCVPDIPTCGDLQYLDPVQNVCTDCPALPNGCSGGNCGISQDTNTVRFYCKACITGFGLGDDQLCHQQLPPTCASYQYLSNNQCVECRSVDNCSDRTCTNGDSSTCTKCKTGYRTDGAGGCTSDGVVPITCLPTQFQHEDQCINCPIISPCAVSYCSSLTDLHCSTCVKGYSLNDAGTCVPDSGESCRDFEYRDASTNTCKECPLPSNCAVRRCSTPNQVICDSCKTGFTISAEFHDCRPSVPAESCNMCPTAGSGPVCPNGGVCCGCQATGVCKAHCDVQCLVTPCQEPTCPTPDACTTRGSCIAHPQGTCAQCNPGRDLLVDYQTGLGIACKPKQYEACNVCEKNTCATGTLCCCGTCREACSFTCASPKCNSGSPPPPRKEIVKVITEHKVPVTCDSPDRAIIEQHIADTITDILGAWKEQGSAQIKHDCLDAKAAKRQSASTSISTETTLDGPGAAEQAAAITQNMPTDSTTNGVPVALVSATASDPQPEDNGLSGGAIAGIVIGSIAASVIVLLVIFFALQNSKTEVV